MKVRKLSPTGDMTFGSSILNFWVDVPEAVGQVVQTSFLLFLGEWYLDTTQGMPWIEGVLGKHNQNTADVTVQDYLTGITGVVDFTNFLSNSEQNQRLYSATFEIDTIFGPTEVEIANQQNF